ncbi:unnamed protein product [Vicia faba]|uniref:Uncharacterized protein n=1 Tax=Vicia faba TaxID=3906 RepID=A0AAV0Z165_VICFA|nr:unnamed protein product [Vicia faba]
MLGATKKSIIGVNDIVLKKKNRRRDLYFGEKVQKGDDYKKKGMNVNFMTNVFNSLDLMRWLGNQPLSEAYSELYETAVQPFMTVDEEWNWNLEMVAENTAAEAGGLLSELGSLLARRGGQILLGQNRG